MNKDITLEDLGYSIRQNDDNKIHYFIRFEKYINFNILTKKIEMCGLFNMEELQAIYNKCKKLGWLDE